MADDADCSRPQFGNRFLSDPTKVFEHNAWDNVEWDSEQEQAAQQKINENSNIKVGEDQQALYEEKADSFWDEFYMQHQNRFFKDRHWLFTEFPELSGPESLDPQFRQNTNSEKARREEFPEKETNLSRKCLENSHAINSHDVAPIDFTAKKDIVRPSCASEETDCIPFGSVKEKLNSSSTESTGDNNLTSGRHCVEAFPGYLKKKRVFEVGCGVGNTVFPILEANNDPDLFVYCCDFSSNAVNLVKEHPDYNTDRCHAFVCDITDKGFVFPFPDESLDIIILIFVLSAIHPDKMQDVICRLSKLLKPGGLILFRDYGRFDMAQLRFKKGKCLSDNFYVRGDGTRVYFFTQECQNFRIKRVNDKSSVSSTAVGKDLSQMFQKAGLVEEQNYVDRRLQVNRGRQLKMYRIWIQCKYRKPR